MHYRHMNVAHDRHKMPHLQAKLGLAILIHSTDHKEATGRTQSESTVKGMNAYEKCPEQIALKRAFH